MTIQSASVMPNETKPFRRRPRPRSEFWPRHRTRTYRDQFGLQTLTSPICMIDYPITNSRSRDLKQFGKKALAYLRNCYTIWRTHRPVGAVTIQSCASAVVDFNGATALPSFLPLGHSSDDLVCTSNCISRPAVFAVAAASPRAVSACTQISRRENNCSVTRHIHPILSLLDFVLISLRLFL